MDQKQADTIIAKIAAIYPAFELTKERVKYWREFMGQIDFNLATKRLDNHISKSKFAPSISEILNPEEKRRKKWDEPETVGPGVIINGGYITVYSDDDLN